MNFVRETKDPPSPRPNRTCPHNLLRSLRPGGSSFQGQDCTSFTLADTLTRQQSTHMAYQTKKAQDAGAHARKQRLGVHHKEAPSNNLRALPRPLLEGLLNEEVDLVLAQLPMHQPTTQPRSSNDVSVGPRPQVSFNISPWPSVVVPTHAECIARADMQASRGQGRACASDLKSGLNINLFRR